MRFSLKKLNLFDFNNPQNSILNLKILFLFPAWIIRFFKVVLNEFFREFSTNLNKVGHIFAGFSRNPQKFLESLTLSLPQNVRFYLLY